MRGKRHEGDCCDCGGTRNGWKETCNLVCTSPLLTSYRLLPTTVLNASTLSCTFSTRFTTERQNHGIKPPGTYAYTQIRTCAYCHETNEKPQLCHISSRHSFSCFPQNTTGIAFPFSCSLSPLSFSLCSKRTQTVETCSFRNRIALLCFRICSRRVCVS